MRTNFTFSTADFAILSAAGARMSRRAAESDGASAQ